ESVIATQRAFRTHFELGRRDGIPTRNTILRWVASFRATGSTLKKKSPGRSRSARTPANVWFQQDGATAQTARLTADLLRGLLPWHISHRGDIPWPARSPDLAPCDFFLWGYLKAEVYKHRPHTLDELQTAIREEIAAIPPKMTVRVMNNFRKRLDVCIRSHGRHMDDIVFHK
ncbi:hypothetical protein B7P43_G04147, partial [Cryptotermes secundus]